MIWEKKRYVSQIKEFNIKLVEIEKREMREMMRLK